MGIWYIQYAILTFFRLLFVISIPYYLYLFFKTKDLSNEVISVVIVFSNSILQALVTFGTNDRYSFPFEFIMIIVVLLFLKDKIKLKRNKIGLV